MATGDGGPALDRVLPPGARMPAATGGHLPHERWGVRLARHAFADQLDAVGVVEEARDDAMLVMSELVSNAVKHAAPLPSGKIIVRGWVQADVLHIEITDGGASTRPHATTAALSSLGGRGLDIVRTVSSQWGVTEAPESVTVWAEVPRRNRPGRSGEPATS